MSRRVERVEIKDEGVSDERYFVYLYDGRGHTFTGLRFGSRKQAERMAAAIRRELGLGSSSGAASVRQTENPDAC